MSDLTTALNRIMNWLERYKPDFADTFLQGLSRKEIEEMTKDLPGKVPEEIYELYQWRNGVRKEYHQAVVYPIPGYLPLEKSLEAFEDFTDGFDEEPFQFEGKWLFPFLQANCSHCAILLGSETQSFSPVIDIADEFGLSLMFNSLTSMMLTLAEYFEMGAYYIGEKNEEAGGRDEEAEGFICPDDDKMLPIFQKYNPGLRLIR